MDGMTRAFQQELTQAVRQRQVEPVRVQEQQHQYIHQQINADQLDQLTNKGSLTKNSGEGEQLGSIREIIQKHMPEAYEYIDDVRQSDNVEARTVRLHHSRGKQFTQQRKPVLEFDMAGSGYSQFRKVHKGFHGKHILDESGKKEEFKKRLKVSWYNKVLSWLPGIKSVEKIQQKNEEINEYNTRLKNKYGIDEDKEQLKQKHKEAVRQQYGEKQEIGGKRMKHIRKKVSADGMKTRITMAGPLELGGLRNAGDYSIENLRNYMLTMGSDYLHNIMKNWSGPQDAYDIHLIIKGHSRGGVAAAEGAMMIKHWVKEHYPVYVDKVKFELIQYDPVPGFGSYAEHATVDHKGQTVEKDGVKMEPLGESAETTVIYSMHTEYKYWFTPQFIDGAKRVILTPFTHGVDLGAVDKTQEQAHRRAYTYVKEEMKENGEKEKRAEVYRSSGINELDEGVYIVDEQNTLIRIEDIATLENILNEFLKDIDTQKERTEIIKAIAGKMLP